VYSPAFIGKNDVNKGNKIILPSSALNELARLKISYPMTFLISNP
jgi:ubiquitin fusion degradation protein 1